MTTTSCSCTSCQSACTTKPGWFLPGEAEKAAALKAMPLRDFFTTYLGVDWFEGMGGNDTVFLLAPAVKSMTPGDMYPSNPRGECVFFVDGKCDIHDAKPHECREYLHGQSQEVIRARHETVSKAWSSQQAQVVELLGREPEEASFEGGGLFGNLFGW